MDQHSLQNGCMNEKKWVNIRYKMDAWMKRNGSTFITKWIHEWKEMDQHSLQNGCTNERNAQHLLQNGWMSQ